MTAKQPAHMAHILAHLDATPTGASNAELDRIFADGVGLAMTRLIQRGQAGSQVGFLVCVLVSAEFGF